MGGFDVVFHATGATTGGAFTLMETIEAEEGPGPPRHVHRDAAETFFVLGGAYEMEVDGEVTLCAPGSTVHVPRGVPHTFRTAAAASRKLNLFVPAAMEGYFRELAEAMARGVGEDELARIAGRHGMEIVGETPESYLRERPER